MAAFPSTLPPPVYDGYSLTPVDPVLRSNMESGAPRSRLLTRARNDIVAVQWMFTQAQMAIFRTWFDADIATGAAGGAAWFSINLTTGGGEIAACDARLAGMWQASLLPGNRWAVSARLEIR